MAKEIWDYSIYPELKDFQKEVFATLGATLCFIQLAENQIRICSMLILPASDKFSLTDFYANKKKAKKTLGQLIHIFKENIIIHDQLDQILESFKNKRNKFVHNLFEDRKYSISNKEGCKAVNEFCNDLQDDARNIQNMFLSSLIKWTKDNGVYEFRPDEMRNVRRSGMKVDYAHILFSVAVKRFVKKAVPVAFCFLTALSIGTSADYLKLKTGEGAKVKISDTAGCYVSYTKGQTELAFKKNLLRYIVVNNDTIDLSTYQCADSGAAAGPGSRNLGSPKADKLVSAIAALPYSSLQSVKTCILCLVNEPVSSNIEDINYDTIFEISRRFFSKNHLELSKIGKDSLAGLLASGQRTNTIVIVPTSVEVRLKYRTDHTWHPGYMSSGPGGAPMMMTGGTYDSTDTKYTELTASMACIDLNSMSIVFKDIYRKKKDNNNFLQFTDADARNRMNELNNSLVSKLYDEALKSILKELRKNNK